MNLLSLLSRELGPPVKQGDRYLWRCPFHDDNSPSLCTLPVLEGKERWKCFGCGKIGDSIDFVKLRYRLSYSNAKKKVEEILSSLSSRSEAPSVLDAAESKIPRFRDSVKNRTETRNLGSGSNLPSWWRAVIDGSRGRLCDQDESGRWALNWLRNRGLTDQTIRAAKLGVNEDGVVIPWFSSSGVPRAVNVRRFNRPPKYLMLKGSAKGILYPDVLFDYGRTVLLCEGEFDTLLARQEAGDLVQAITFGSASDSPSSSVLIHLIACQRVLVGFDADPAGDSAWRRLSAVLKHARRLHLPKGQDLTDLHLSSPQGLRGWLLANVQ